MNFPFLPRIPHGLAALSVPAAKVERPLTLPLETREKLGDLARIATKAGARRLSASDVAAALLERAVTTG